MKYFYLTVFTILFFLAHSVWAQNPEPLPTTEELKTHVVTETDYSQLFFLQGGSFTPRSIEISNGDYRFKYDEEALQSYQFQAGWALKLLDFLGAWHLEENVGFTSFSGNAGTLIRGHPEMEELRLNLMSLDSQIMYSMEWFPWKSLTPFVDGGYQYTFYSQTGRSDLDSAQGGFGNLTAGAGFRLWLNRGLFKGGDSISRFVAVPVFLTAKTSWVYGNGNSVDLSSQSYYAGLAVAL